jgi:hypothetical protein
MMLKKLERLKNTVNKCMADLRPDRLMTYQSERKLVISRRPGILRWAQQKELVGLETPVTCT